MKFLKEHGGWLAAIVLAVLGLAFTWGATGTRLDSLEKKQDAQQQQLDDLRDKMSRIDTNVEVIKAWVDEQKKGRP